MTTLEALEVIRNDPHAVYQFGIIGLEIGIVAFMVGFLAGWAFKWWLG